MEQAMADTTGGGPPSRREPGAASPLDRVPSWLAQLGLRGWLFVGVVLAAAIVYSALATVASLVVPLIVAVVVGVLFAPLVTRAARAHVPRRITSALVILGLAGISTVSIWLAVKGIAEQAPEIGRELAAGLDRVFAWIEDLGVSMGDGSEVVDNGYEAGRWLLSGLAGSLTSVFSSAAAFLIGVFVGVFLLYYLLAEWDALVAWTAEHLGTDRTLAASILDDAGAAIREYFTGLTISAILVALTIGLAMALLGLPLALTIGLVTFVTAYVPYLGAIFSGAFAFLVALGSGGLTEALIVLAVVLVAQNVLQTLVQTKLTSDRLQIHPLVNFGSTIVGAALAGILGATLSAPIVATLVRLVGRIRDHRATAPVNGGPADG
jgi:predicted PurR-regulated permease PerM